MANAAGVARPHEQTDKTTGFVYLAAALAAITGLLFGLDTGGISGAILFITQTFNLSTLMTEVVTATVLVGAVIGAAVSGRLADTLGRRKLIIIMGVVFVVGSAAEAAAQTLSWLAAPLVVGFGIGAASFIGPLYIAEISPKNIRRTARALQPDSRHGRHPASLRDRFRLQRRARQLALDVPGGRLPGAALTIGMYFLPESPRWLVSHGRTDEAMSKATIFNWGFNLLVALTFLSMLQTLGQPVTVFIFGGVSIATFFFSYFLVPETRGRSLEEIEAQWQARVGAQRGP